MHRCRTRPIGLERADRDRVQNCDVRYWVVMVPVSVVLPVAARTIVRSNVRRSGLSRSRPLSFHGRSDSVEEAASVRAQPWLGCLTARRQEDAAQGDEQAPGNHGDGVSIHALQSQAQDAAAFHTSWMYHHGQVVRNRRPPARTVGHATPPLLAPANWYSPALKVPETASGAPTLRTLQSAGSTSLGTQGRRDKGWATRTCRSVDWPRALNRTMGGPSKRSSPPGATTMRT